MFSKNTKKDENEVDSGKGRALVRKLGVYTVRYFDALVAIFVLIIFVFGFFFFINPKYKQITETEMYSQSDLEKEKDSLDAYLAKLTEYKKTYQNLSSSGIERIGKMVPEGDKTENFFARIENITKKQGLVLSSLEVSEEGSDAKSNSLEKKEVTKATGGVKNINISLEVAGIDYIGLKRLIIALENDLRLMDIVNINFSVENKSVIIQLLTYSLE